jgi:hypothetical protein
VHAAGSLLYLEDAQLHLDPKDVAAYRNQLQKELDAMKAKEAKDIANCVATKSSMAEHYWQPRDKLERKLRATQALLEVLC